MLLYFYFFIFYLYNHYLLGANFEINNNHNNNKDLEHLVLESIHPLIKPSIQTFPDHTEREDSNTRVCLPLQRSVQIKKAFAQSPALHVLELHGLLKQIPDQTLDGIANKVSRQVAIRPHELNLAPELVDRVVAEAASGRGDPRGAHQLVALREQSALQVQRILIQGRRRLIVNASVLEHLRKVKAHVIDAAVNLRVLDLEN